MRFFKFCKPSVNLGDVILVKDGKKIILLERCESIGCSTSQLVELYKNHPEYTCYIWPANVFVSLVEDIIK